ncbi:MAG: hypothetical protein NW224_10535 [Leptolyngbyaceae cyanobacterium bins.302]|nr:hypothetical protein [Leptolyngbyaceae cyanobacterium bins.302]
MATIDIEPIMKGIRRLQQVQEQLQARELSPEGAWIHQYQVTRSYPSGNVETYCYAKWQAKLPIFSKKPKRHKRSQQPEHKPAFTCHQHIGRVSSTTGLGMDEAVRAAYNAWNNRKKLTEVEQALTEIQKVLEKTEGQIGKMEDKSVLEKNK